MTNREKYQQAFSAIHISDDFSLEESTMKKRKFYHYKYALVALLACVCLLGSAAAVYATDFCGIQRKVQLWFYGEQTDVTIQFNGNGQYELDYLDEDGTPKSQAGGGVAFDANGKERPLTEAELMAHLTAPEVEYREDGSVWVYWFDQSVEISDKFEDGICYIQLLHGEETLYMTVEYDNGYSTSPDKYVLP